MTRKHTHRTTTAQWKNLRTYAIKQAQANGLTRCPWCQTPIAWDSTGQPNSPELDHIIPYSHGGQDTHNNLQILCRTCNRKKGNKLTPPTTQKPIKTSRNW